MLKGTVLDPQGKAIQKALESLGYQDVRDVRQGKFFVVDLNGSTRESAQKQMERIVRDVLEQSGHRGVSLRDR